MISKKILHFVSAVSACFSAVGTLEAKSQREPIPIDVIQQDGPVNFEKQILPFLRKNCIACHSRSTKKGDINLESARAALANEVDGDPIVIPGRGMESLLLKVSARLEKPFMPKKNNLGAGPLTSRQLGLLKLWIDQGAKVAIESTTETPKPKTIQWQPLPRNMKSILTVALVDSGELAACSRANQIFVYQTPGGRELARMTDPTLIERGLYKNPGVAHLDTVQSLAFHPDGDLLASGGPQPPRWCRSSPLHCQVRG